MTKVLSVIISRVFYTKIAVVARARPLPTIWAHRDKRRPLPRLQRQENGWDLRGHRLHGLYDEESVWGWINKSSVWRWNQIVDKTVFSRRYTPCDRLRTPSETTSSSSWDWTYRHHGKSSFCHFLLVMSNFFRPSLAHWDRGFLVSINNQNDTFSVLGKSIVGKHFNWNNFF